MSRIDWDSMNTLERAASLRLMSGEAKTLTPAEVDLFNTQLRIALQALEPVIELVGAARERFAARQAG